VTQEDFTRYVAAFVATIGAFVVSPHGTALVLSHAARPLVLALDWLNRWVPFLRRGATAHPVTAHATLTATGSVRVRASRAWPARPTVKSLSEVVRQALDDVDRELNDIWETLGGQRSEAKQELVRVRERLDGSLSDLQARMNAAERVQAEHDARALPGVGVGALMGIIPREIAALPLLLYILLLVGVGYVTINVALSAKRTRRALKFS
jgi:F0F1-type ATP synthase assembly protein I